MSTDTTQTAIKQNDGNKLDPVQAGLPPDFPEEIRAVVTGGKSEISF